jgi:hypothetical protein
VSGRFEPLAPAARAGAGETPYGGSEQRALIFLERQDVLATPLEHRRSEGAMAMQRIGGDGAVLEGEQGKHFQATCHLVAAGGLARSQGHSRFGCEDIDQLHWSGAASAFVRSPQSFAVDRDDASQPMEFRKCRHEASERCLEAPWIEHSKHPTEGVVTGDPMFQPQELPQQSFLRLAELLHVAGTFRSTEHRSQGNEQNFHQRVTGIGSSWIGQPSENLLEFPHATPLSIGESPSESIRKADATSSSNSYAIPLPSRGQALVIGAPQVIWLAGKGERRSGRPVAPRPSTFDQAMAVEDNVDRTDRRRMDIGIEAGQPLLDLRGAPARLVLLQAHDLRLDLEGQLIGMAVWPARAVGEPFDTDLIVASGDLVAGLTRYAELTAQPRHLLPVQEPGNEFEALIHRVTLLPGHFCSPAKSPIV